MSSINQRFTDALLAAMSPEERERLQKTAFEKFLTTTPIEDLLALTSPPEPEPEEECRCGNNNLDEGKPFKCGDCGVLCCFDCGGDDTCDDCLHKQEEEDEWMDVYNRPCPFKEFIHPSNKDLAPYATGIFYQTYGGGPEGGYVKMPDGAILKVERTWGQPFKVMETFTPGELVWQSRPADEAAGRAYLQIRVVNPGFA
jgi:hypothetical protein